MLKFMKCFLFLLFAFSVSFSDVYCAESNSNPELISTENVSTDIIEEELTYDEAKEKVDSITQAMQEDISKEDIDKYVAQLSKMESFLTKKREIIEKDTKYLQKQLDALSTEPQELEDESITKQREEISQNLAAQNKIIKEADLLIIQIEDLTVKIINLRNQKIYGDLITKQSAYINPMVFFNGVKSYVIFFWDVVKSPLDWYNSIPQQQRSYALFSIVSMFFILIIALIMAIMLRRYILNNWGYKADIEKPSFNRKLVAAVAVATARGVIFMFLIIGFIIWMNSTQIFAESFLNTVLNTIAFCLLLVIVEATVSRVTFAPKFPQWRLLNVTNEKALRFTKMIFFYILCNALALMQMYIAKNAEYPTETQHFLMIISCAVTAFFLIWFARICFDADKTEQAENLEKEEANDESRVGDHKLKMLMLSYSFCTITFAASLFGYPELSLFILRRTVFSLILCGLFEVFRRSLLEIIRKIIYYMPLMKKYKNSKRIADKISFWLKATINPLLILILVFLLLNLWGLPGDFILLAVKKILFGFKIGGIQISLLAIMLGIGVFFGSLTVSRIIKNKLAVSLQSSDMDDGIKHSLVSGISFVGFIISILLAIVSMGIDLTSLAFIAGALSVGIGFGLQDVIKNLVAGIIILLERPFRVGDWVVMNGEEGKIKQINIRSTEMETFKRTSVIIPNATLISSTVTNLTHDDNMARQSVKVGVSYNSDPEKVKQILLESAKEHKNILQNPAPYVLFQDFGASSLDFELRYYIRNLWESWPTPSDLRYTIFKKFAENGIEIPFNQLVVYNGDKQKEQE